jgi:hypothetical protein
MGRNPFYLEVKILDVEILAKYLDVKIVDVEDVSE